MKEEKSQQAAYDLMSRLYLSDTEKNFAYNKLTKQRFSEDELKVTEVNNGIILPCKGKSGGVCTDQFKFVAGHFENKPVPGVDISKYSLISSSYTVAHDELEFVDETIVFGGVMQDHPGHQMLEGICNRMWWHLKNPDSKLRFAFLVIWGNGSGRFVKEFLDLLGIPEERIVFIKKPTQFSKVIVPDQSIIFRDFFTKEYMLVINKIKQNVTPGKTPKIFFTKNAKNDMVNQEYFTNFFAQKGFKIIDPENYTLREKVEFMLGADEVAGFGGTSSLYAVFCNPSVKLIILGRANDPVAEQFIPYEAAQIKDMYVIDVSLNFLHKNRVWGINLIGPTKYWRQFIQDFYHENINETQEDTIKEFAYEYLKKCAEYYSKPSLFTRFKGFSHFQIINLMNKVFFDKELDPGKFDTSTVESTIRDCKNVLNFCFELNFDNNRIHKFDRFMNKLSGSNIAILKQQDKAAAILKEYANANHVNITYLSNKVGLHQLTPPEFSECKKADVIISCCVHGTKTHERDGVKCIDIWDILRDDSLTADLPALPETRCIEIESELKRLSDELVEQSKSLNMVYAACADSTTEKMLRDEINILHTDKELLRKELSRSTAENNMLNEHISRINAEKDSLSNDVLKLTQEKSSLDIKLHEAESSVDALESVKKNNADELARIAKMLDDEQNANYAAMLKINELTVQKTDLAKEKVKLEDETTALNLKIGTLTDQNNDLVNTKAELEYRSEELNARIDILNSQKAELTSVAANLTAETETLNKKVDELNDTNNRLSAECIQAMQLYDDEKKANLAAAKSMDKLAAEKDSMSKRIRELEIMLKEEQIAALALKAEIEKMKSSRSWRYTKIFRGKQREEQT